MLTLARRGAVAVVTLDNPPVNALSHAVRRSLFNMAEELDEDDSVAAVVLACAGRTFIAGADVTEFGKPPAPPFLPDVIHRIEAGSKPWVAAIHGAALGGGLEVALGCAARVAAASATLGFPEVTLGIVPGAGGTTRTPRLIGPQLAAELVTSGKAVTAAAAKAMGLIDEVAAGDLIEAAVAYADTLAHSTRPMPIHLRAVTTLPDAFWDEKRAALAKSARGEIAPLRALDCVRKTTETDFDTAAAYERYTFLDLRRGAQSHALRAVFFAERAAPRPPELKDVAARPLKSVGVIGGGTMGAGIAAAALLAGLKVTLIERDAAALKRGQGTLRALIEGAAKRGRMSAEAAQESLASVVGASDYAALKDVDLVVEAVFEDLVVKRAAFEQAARVVRADAILATNTSYLDPEAIFAGAPHPERCLGLHFFSPAHVMRLIEIVPLKATAPDVLTTGFALARAMNKIPVRAGVCDGFIGNRLLKVVRAQAERLLLAGATPTQVDAAMRGFGLSMGPFEAQDLGGLDIAAAQRQAARARGETPFAPVAERLCALQRFGQKSGGGWYDYVPGERAPRASMTVEHEIRAAAQESGASPAALDEGEIQRAIVLPMVDEGAKILAEGAAARASDIDLVKIHGYGFPRWRGGPMLWATTHGLDLVVHELEQFAANGLAPAPSEALRRAAVKGAF
jgi:3-hydroxyacyl-CoA dehydrogenase